MNTEVKYYRNLHSNRGIIARPLIFLRRIIRRLLRFLIEPIVQEQNEINKYAFYSVKTQLAELKSEIHLDVDKNQQKIDEFQHKIDELQHKIDELQHKIDEFNLKSEAGLNEVLQSVEAGKSMTDEMLAKEKLSLQAAINELFAHIDKSELQVVRAIKNIA